MAPTPPPGTPLPDYMCPPAQPNMAPSLGSMLVGSWLGNVLLGLDLCLAYRYFSTAKADKLVVDILVVVLCILDVLHTVSYSESVWLWAIRHWSNAAALDTIDWGWWMSVVAMGLISTIVQVFFSWRVFWISKTSSKRGQWYLPVIITFLGLFQLGWAFMGAISTATLKHPSKFHTLSWALYIWYGSTATADILITGGMLFYLRRAKARTGFTHTHTLLNRLLVLTLETNALTLLSAVCVIIFFVAKITGSGDLIFQAIIMVQAKFYIVSCFWTLGARVGKNDSQPGTSSRGSSAAKVPSYVLSQNSMTSGRPSRGDLPSSPRTPTSPMPPRVPAVHVTSLSVTDYEKSHFPPESEFYEKRRDYSPVQANFTHAH